VDRDSIAANLARVRDRIAVAAREAGRDPGSVRLLPVSKTVSAECLRHAIAAGLDRFGENRVQEARDKVAALAQEDLDWVVIGHLQTNKAKYVARFASEVQSIDRLKVARALDARLQAEGRGLDVLIQVNTSGEPSKYGVEPTAASTLLHEISRLPSLRVRGLMTLALFSADPDRIRVCFRCLRQLRDRLRDQAPDGVNLDTLSMGMSPDYELAIAEGATEVRIGTAIFGQRPTSDSFYWPGSASE
jgi:hypothetical protein